MRQQRSQLPGWALYGYSASQAPDALRATRSFGAQNSSYRSPAPPEAVDCTIRGLANGPGTHPPAPGIRAAASACELRTSQRATG